MNKFKRIFLPSLIIISVLLSACAKIPANNGYSSIISGYTASDLFDSDNLANDLSDDNQKSYSLKNIPDFSGKPYVIINENKPEFSKDDYIKTSFEYYHRLDSLGRCQTAYANIGKDIMPTGDRESISHIKPTGWQSVEYDCVDGKYLYNRCHLIGYQLTAENANERNLITGTRYMNVDGMLPFENMVADYIKETGNHVLYRVTPVFKKWELVARGVHMEAESVEDNGEGICFNVYVYNCQPGVKIDYSTGESTLDESGTFLASSQSGSENASKTADYILNTNSKKFHYTNCKSVQDMSDDNKQDFRGKREDLIKQGYSPCGNCKP